MIIRRNNFPFKRMNASLHPQLIASRNHIGDFFDSVKNITDRYNISEHIKYKRKSSHTVAKKERKKDV